MADDTPVNGVDLDVPTSDAPAAPATPEERIANLEGIVRAQHGQIAELQRVVRAMVANQAVEKLRPAVEDQIRAAVMSQLENGFTVG